MAREEIRTINNMCLCDTGAREEIVVITDNINNIFETLNNKSDKDHKHEEYTTLKMVSDLISQIDLSIYATKEYTNTTISNILINYATKDYVNEMINTIDLSDYVKHNELDDYITKDEVEENYATKEDLTKLNYVSITEFNQFKQETQQKFSLLESLMNSLMEQFDKLREDVDKLIEENRKYTVTYGLTEGVQISNKENEILTGTKYTNTITYSTGYKPGTVVVTMGGVDITKDVVASNEIIIEEVTGNIIIRIEAVKEQVFKVTYNISNCSKTSTVSSVKEGGSYYVQIAPDLEYEIGTVLVTMGGLETAYTITEVGGVEIDIKEVTGDIVITVTGKKIKYTITYNLPNCSSNINSKTIESGKSYSTQIVGVNEYEVDTVKVTMGGIDITSSCVTNYAYGKNIDIAKVTGNIVITATTVIKCTVTYNLHGGISSENKTTTNKDESYKTVITLPSNSILTFISGKVTMNGSDVTSSCCTVTESSVTINIASVTGDIVIDTRTAEKEIPCERIAFSQASISVSSSSGTLNLKPYLILTPSNCNQQVLWYCDNDYLPVSNGVVTLSSTGSYKIQALCGKFAATIQVTIS